MPAHALRSAVVLAWLGVLPLPRHRLHASPLALAASTVQLEFSSAGAGALTLCPLRPQPLFGGLQRALQVRT